MHQSSEEIRPVRLVYYLGIYVLVVQCIIRLLILLLNGPFSTSLPLVSNPKSHPIQPLTLRCVSMYVNRSYEVIILAFPKRFTWNNYIFIIYI